MLFNDPLRSPRTGLGQDKAEATGRLVPLLVLIVTQAFVFILFVCSLSLRQCLLCSGILSYCLVKEGLIQWYETKHVGLQQVKIWCSHQQAHEKLQRGALLQGFLQSITLKLSHWNNMPSWVVFSQPWLIPLISSFCTCVVHTQMVFFSSGNSRSIGRSLCVYSDYVQKRLFGPSLVLSGCQMM